MTGAQSREQRQADRAALVAQLQAMPQAMRDLPQWLLWKFLRKPGASKPAKVPYYVNGELRGWPRGRPRDGRPTADQPQVAQGDELDRAHLVTLDEAIRCLQRGQHWDGIGFAFLPGDGLIGVDIDGAIDPDTGEISDLCQDVITRCASFAEHSVSGTGVHIICTGTVEPFKDDGIGLEVYCGSQYFICTGRPWPGMPAEAQPADPEVMAHLRQLVMDSKERQAEAKAAEAAAARAAQPPRPSAPPRAARAAGDGVDEFRLVNDEALRSLSAWVPSLLPAATEFYCANDGGWSGYRVTSKALGRKLQEDLQFSPHGIMDYGEERGYSPIDSVMRWMPSCSTPKAALEWLAGRLNITLSRARPSSRPAGSAAGDQRPEPPPLGEPAPAPASEPEGASSAAPPSDAESNVVSLEKQRAARKKGKGKGDAQPADGDGDEDAPKERKRKRPPEFWERVNALCERFALIYGSDSAWDERQMLMLKVSAMRLAFGGDEVKYWLQSDSRRMVLPTDLVFEPGQEVAAPKINMWGGLELKPQACEPADVKPMIDLLRHLCSESAPTGDEVDAVMHWVLCWQALPLQKLGTKMQTACVFHGAQGTGKNLYWDVWRDMFGVYGITVGQTELEDKFNGWVSRKLAIIGDEVVSRQEMYHNKNRLKLVVTQEKKFPIRGMQMETRWESNHANVVFLSNESQPLALEERDRRYMVIYTPLEADVGLYERVRDFLANGGAAKWLHYLQTYPVEDFNAHTKPLMTRAKEDLIEAGWRPAVRFGFDWIHGYLDLPLRVCSSEQLYRAFRRWCDRSGERWPPAQAGFTSELKRWAKERVKRDASGRLEPPLLTHKEVTPKDSSTGTRLKTIRCWFPAGTGPLPGVPEGEWAWDSVKEFEGDVRRYCHRPGVPDPEGDAS